MPETDGLEATLQIRAAESSKGTRQTIIALTAHAMPSDRVRCQEVGMDGFLVKPIAFDALKQAVDAVMQSAESIRTETTLTQPAAPVAAFGLLPADNNAGFLKPPVLFEFDPATMLDDAPSWSELLSMFNGNASLLAEVLSLLIREAPRMRKLFDMSLEQGNSLEARRAVHTLKSNVRYVGLTKVAAVAERLERIAREGHTDQLRQHSQPLAQTIDHVINWSETMLRSR